MTYPNRVEKVTDALGHDQSRQYNSSGNVIEHTDALGAVARLGYDISGHNVKSSTLPTGASSTYDYTDSTYTRSATGTTDAQKNLRQFAYDPATGNPALVRANKDAGATGPEAGEYYHFEYNTEAGKAGTMRSATDPDGKLTTFTYNARGERETVVHPAPLGGEAFTYDGASRVENHTDGMGRTTTYTYDAYDRVTSVTYGDGSVISYTYDRVGNRRSMTERTGGQARVTDYDYDDLNRIERETLPPVVLLRPTNAYTYDKAGNLDTYTDAADTVTYTHNQVNLVDTVTEPGGHVTTLEYDNANRRKKVIYPNGVAEESGYDTSGRFTSIRATKAGNPNPLTDFTYEYKKAGADTSLRQWVEDKVAGERTTYVD